MNEEATDERKENKKTRKEFPYQLPGHCLSACVCILSLPFHHLIASTKVYYHFPAIKTVHQILYNMLSQIQCATIIYGIYVWHSHKYLFVKYEWRERLCWCRSLCFVYTIQPTNLAMWSLGSARSPHSILTRKRSRITRGVINRWLWNTFSKRPILNIQYHGPVCVCTMYSCTVCLVRMCCNVVMPLHPPEQFTVRLCGCLLNSQHSRLDNSRVCVCVRCWHVVCKWRLAIVSDIAYRVCFLLLFFAEWEGGSTLNGSRLQCTWMAERVSGTYNITCTMCVHRTPNCC